MADVRSENEESQSLYGALSTPRNFDEGIESSDVRLTSSLFDAYESEIFASRPDIFQIVEEIGNKTFYEYSKSHIRENRNPSIKQRKKELHEAMYEEIWPLLGTKIARSVVRQLKDNDSVSTIQHSVPLGHPYILSAVFQNATPYMGEIAPHLQNVIVLANSLASFNNYSFPRADLLHLLTNKSLDSLQLSFFGQTKEASPTIFQEPFGDSEIQEIKKRIMQQRQAGKLNKEEGNKILRVVDEVYSNPHVLSQSNYLDQLTILNYNLFKYYTKGYSKQIPNLVFLSQELITLRLLKQNHMNMETVLGNLMFNEDFHKLFLKEFDGLNGAFSIEHDKGTFLFWAYPKGAKHRERLRLTDGILKSVESDYEVALTPEEVNKAILNNELIPSTSLVFIVLAFYYGLFLGGGVAQVKNLEALKKAYMSLLDQAKMLEEVSIVENLNVGNLLISRPTFLFMKWGKERVPLTGMDIVTYGEKMNWDEVMKATRSVKMREVLARSYPFYYSQFTKKKEEVYESINESDIENYKELDLIIPALFSVSKDS
ncbi:MAG: hypothetical protein KA035_01315 [Candidatus Levybacteria bacterium]|nr:hypothetical protein [Candidatus Levybacteria bacterium]